MSAILERARTIPRGELAALALFVAALVVSVAWTPADGPGELVLCPFRAATGLPCPGCGLTHAFCATAKGHVAAAFGYHALGPILFAVMCAYVARGAAAVAGAQTAVARFDAAVGRWRLVRLGLVALLVAWVARLVALAATGQLPELLRHGLLLGPFLS